MEAKAGTLPEADLLLSTEDSIDYKASATDRLLEGLSGLLMDRDK